MPKKVLTLEMQLYILENYLLMSKNQMAKNLGISSTPINSFLKEKNITIPKEVGQNARIQNLKKPITQKEIQYIHQNIHQLSIKKIARNLHRTSVLISTTAHQLGYTDLIKENSLNSQYKKGKIPHNKGKKVDAKTYEILKRTMFKKGHLPYNTQYNGAISLRHSHPERGDKPYLYIRISKAKWVLLHRHIWQQHNGPIPENHVIAFKNGDTMNCNIENLECISMEENMQRNSIQRFPKDLISTIKINHKIKKSLQNEKS